MGRICDRMVADLELAGRSVSTRSHYIGCARAFVKYFMVPPDRMGEEHVRRFLLHLVRVRKVSVGRYLQYLGAIKFLYRVTLRRPEAVASIPWPKMRRRLPDVLTRDEVARVLDAAPSPYWRAFLTTAYAAGLRRMEVAALRAADVDSASGLLRVVHGKGDKPRLVRLEPTLLTTLREHWRCHRLPGPWLFPARGRSGWADHPVALRLASDAFRRARSAAGIDRRVTLHGLRHAFATHHLEGGLDVFTLQALLGHEDIETTSRYTRIRTDRIRSIPGLLDQLRS